MKTTLTITLLFLLMQFSFGQNLVPNPSFEDTLACPDNQSQVYKALGWCSFGNTSDYFNSCVIGAFSLSVPSNAQGYQFAVNNGNAYCGLYTRWSSLPYDTLYREFIGSQLSSPLMPNTKYFIRIKVSRADGIKCATNKLGVLFSTVPYSENNPVPINNFAHIFTNNIISDTANWTTINGSFTADSAYEYIIIGNFFYNYLTDTLSFDGLPCTAYYYVDDIYVSTDSINGITQNLIENSINISPNPANNTINLTFPKNNCNAIITISDLHGIFQKKYFSSNQLLLIDTKDFNSGLFLVNIEFTNGIRIIKKIIITH
jgi:hypothetical protein